MLKFRFDSQYPIASPSVTFVVNQDYQAPLHPVRILHSISSHYTHSNHFHFLSFVSLWPTARLFQRARTSNPSPLRIEDKRKTHTNMSILGETTDMREHPWRWLVARAERRFDMHLAPEHACIMYCASLLPFCGEEILI